MNSLRYIQYLISECEKKHQHLTDLLHEFSDLELHTKHANGSCRYMIHRPGQDPLYARRQERPLCRELAVKRDVESQLEDCRIDLAILLTLKQSMEAHPHVRDALYGDADLRILLDEAYDLLRRNGSFFNEKEWCNMISGKMDERFWNLAEIEYRKIVQTERARLYAAGHSTDLSPDKIQIPERISPRLQKIRENLTQADKDPRIRAWLNEDYQKNPYLRENLIYPAFDGEKFRSKLEVHTAEILKHLGIAYRYEAALQIGNNIYYPDFTLLHPKTYKLIYLEILGMMSNEEYRRNAAKKLYIYSINGLTPGKNLLVYTETDDEPLDFEFMTMELKHKLLQ